MSIHEWEGRGKGIRHCITRRARNTKDFVPNIGGDAAMHIQDFATGENMLLRKEGREEVGRSGYMKLIGQ